MINIELVKFHEWLLREIDKNEMLLSKIKIESVMQTDEINRKSSIRTVLRTYKIILDKISMAMDFNI